MEILDHHHLVSISTLISFVILTQFSQTTTAGDADVMFKFAKSITPSPPGWSGSDPCKWDGVSCSRGSVVNINLKSKSLSGKIPPEINELTNLRDISFQQNNFDGQLPPLSNLVSLQKVFLNGNEFTSIPPDFLNNLPSLQTVSISNNPLKPWKLPDSLMNLTSIQTFEAANTSLYGEIPDFFGMLPSLQELRLSYNNLTGGLPSSFGGSGLQKLWINNQETGLGLSGSISVLSEMTSLSQAWLHGNNFSGPIPDLSNCTRLYDLNIGSNQLTGVVPESLTKLPSLKNVSLQGNLLQGPIPSFGKDVDATVGPSNSFCTTKPGPCDPQVTALLAIAGGFGYPKLLAHSWTGNDACDDSWAHVTCTDKIVTGINLARQGLTGVISPAFGELKELTMILLNDNDLYGKVPRELTELKKLRRLDVRNNNLTGDVPKFASVVKVNVDGNKFIGSKVDTTPKSPPDSDDDDDGGVLSSSEYSPESLAPSESAVTSKPKKSYLAIAGVVVFIAVLLILFTVLYKKGKLRFGRGSFGFDEESGIIKKKNTTNNSKVVSSGGASPFHKSSHAFESGNVVYPFELLQKATDNFSEKNVLGRGGFGIVYKGILPDGTLIAVKRMESDSMGNKGMAEFEAEITVLSRVRHRHLVALLGYCVNGFDRIVVYEFMPQGTMSQHLFDWRGKGLQCLTWKQRVVIALDVARGVEYLHSLAQQSFIHRDLKPSNVLLGNDMRAKVSDFGLVKLAPDGKYSLETRLAGTFGYLAPEYASTGRVTTKIDVFAFGVILMEMITGRKALDDSLPEEMVQLSSWFRRILLSTQDVDLKSHIDTTLNPIDDEKLQSIHKVAELAGHCTAREPKDRPDMSHAVSVLLPLVEEWRPAPTATNYDDGADTSMVSIPLAMKKWQSGDSTFEDYSMTHSQSKSSS